MIKESVRNKHHKETYGRSLDSSQPISPVLNTLAPPLSQRQLFSLPSDTTAGIREQLPGDSNRNQDELLEEEAGTS